MTVTSGIVQPSQSVGGLQNNPTTQYVQATQLSTVSNTYYFAFQVLTRNAKRRRVAVNGPYGASFTPLDQYVTVSVGVVDSTWFPDTGTVSGSPNDVTTAFVDWRTGANNLATSQANIGVSVSYGADFDSDGQTSYKNGSPSSLGSQGDILIVEVVTGTTAPTAGKLPIYIWEEL